MENNQIPFDFENENTNESQESTKKSISVLSSLENMRLKLEYLEGITQVCANAFSTPGALSAVNEHDLENSFLSLREQIKALENETGEIITAIVTHNAHLNY